MTGEADHVADGVIKLTNGYQIPYSLIVVATGFKRNHIVDVQDRDTRWIEDHVDNGLAFGTLGAIAFADDTAEFIARGCPGIYSQFAASQSDLLLRLYQGIYLVTNLSLPLLHVFKRRVILSLMFLGLLGLSVLAYKLKA